MKLRQITTNEELETALGTDGFLLFKHSESCPTSAFAFAEYRAYLEKHPATPSAWIDVIDGRPLSQAVATQTGIKHESPQALVFVSGRVAWHASHGAITASSLAGALSGQEGLSSSR